MLRPSSPLTSVRARKLHSLAQRWIACALLALLGVNAAAAADAAAGSARTASGTALDRYLDGMKSLRTAFTQSVTDARGTLTDAGAGTLVVLRPGKFRWDYQPRTPADAADATSASHGERGQLLVADGKNLWFYDRELAQVSVKPVAAALSATPVMLLSGTVEELHDSFDIAAAGSARRPGLGQRQAAQRRIGLQSCRARLCPRSARAHAGQ